MRVSSLSAGMYKLTVRKEGFRTLARVGVPLQATETGRVDFLLDIGSMQEVVTVESVRAADDQPGGCDVRRVDGTCIG